MIHAVAYILFILPFTAWLGFELRRRYSLRTRWHWLAGAFVIGMVGSQVFRIYPGVFGNFLLHMSGGASAALLFIYLSKTLSIDLNWRLAALTLFAFVCMLGVLNEFAEYFFELVGFGPYSLDRHDTWRDFVANTAGAAITWIIYEGNRLMTGRRPRR